MNFHQRGRACVVPPREYTCVVPLRHVAAVTARDAFSTAGDKRVLLSNTIIWVDFQEIYRCFLVGDASPISLTARKLFPTTHFSNTFVTVTGNVHPWS